jgi:uncharacterized membrane protein SpoIIM required for sporulation
MTGMWLKILYVLAFLMGFCCGAIWASYYVFTDDYFDRDAQIDIEFYERCVRGCENTLK